MVDWPEGIPFFKLRSGYGAEPGENTLRTPMDVGPAKVRRRTTSAPSVITGSAYMTREEAQRFEQFWRDTLKDGALSFTLSDGLYRRRNLLVQSEDFSAGWSKSGELTRTDAASVIPGATASRFDNDGTLGSRSVLQGYGDTAGGAQTVTWAVENVNAASFAVGIRNATDSAWVSLYTYTWATQTLTVFGGSGSAVARPRGTGPNGGALVDVSVSGTAPAGKAVANYIYPTGTPVNTDSAIVHWSQAELSPAFTQYEPVGASYRSNDLTRGSLKNYRIVGVPQFAPMGIGHRVSVSLEVLP